MQMQGASDRILAWSDMLAEHPETWVLTLAAAAWLTLVLSHSPAFAQILCLPEGTGAASQLASTVRAGMSTLRPDDGLRWAAMVVAMMLPLTAPSVRHVACRSYAWRRNRAVAGFLAGFLVVWLAAGIGFLILGAVVLPYAAASPVWTIAAVLALATGWQLAPAKARALRRCHRTVALRPSGWRADVSCMRFGIMQGGACLASCWALMLLLVVLPHGVLAMTAAMAFLAAERFLPSFLPRLSASALLLGAPAALLGARLI